VDSSGPSASTTAPSTEGMVTAETKTPGQAGTTVNAARMPASNTSPVAPGETK
jgi:hypothetical protein